MKISVIIPTYKPQDYLWECLNSLVAQTFPKEDFEVILVLNGCAEPWKSQIEDYISTRMQSLNVNFIYIEQGGVSNARNIALDIAKGEYITFMDDDDLVSPCFLEALYMKAAEDTIVLCYPYAFNDGAIEIQLPYVVTSEYEKVYGKGKINYRKARRFFGGPWMKLIPMSYINNRRYDLRFKNGEDTLFMFLISDKFKYIETADKKCVYYRRYRENSAYTMKQSWISVAKNEYYLVCAYTKIFLSDFFKYSFSFYSTRVLGAVKSLIKF